ncbi:pentapeptide repeat-containing protein [Streptomyces malaysiensis]|uniref:Pentapeptide repeat-containing protein n=1 Tax=Streptomyces malaysiensis subsp. samsunensis TaxID=459658 RepID=A0A9X2RW93_STRMQ|nr:pentapeptide repeat-containing protein [Streptomyces samsunensis]MCQ8833052.1 pentapeptide repeat-containing protein [Streptomyces samsunensis]
MAQAIRRGGSTSRVRNPAAPKALPALRPADMARDGLEDDAMIRGVQYEGTPFVALTAEAVEVEGCTFDSSRFNGTHLVRSQFSDCRFNTCDFAEVGAQDVSLIRCTVDGSRLTGSSWKSGTFRDVRMESCVIAPGLFRHMKLYAVAFIDCKMVGADFQSAEMHNVRFESCDLTGAQWSNCQVDAVRFERCTLVDVGGGASLKGATVQGPGQMELALSLAREAGIRFE